ncbi:hypothetical protein [Streptomyces sp. NPDC007984]|uniref:hypothetical protein n=1 Tax=Streptomyces sp. NPDC007984 TaxID=3364801 RepID=UPI0036ED5AF2
MSTITTEDATRELPTLDAQITEAEEQLARVERELGQAARGGRSIEPFARQVETAESHLKALQERKARQAVLARIQEREQGKTDEARKAQAAAVKANAAALKREVAQLDDSAQEAAQAVLEAVSAIRAAIDRLRLHSVSVKAAAGRLEALGLTLRDEYGNTFDTGASIGSGKAAVRHGGKVFTSLGEREMRQVLHWMNARVDRAEFHGRDMGTGYLAVVDPGIRERLEGRR